MKLFFLRNFYLIYSGAIVCYVLLGTPAGYTSARLCKSKKMIFRRISFQWILIVFGGDNWKKNVLMTAVACPGY